LTSRAVNLSKVYYSHALRLHPDFDSDSNGDGSGGGTARAAPRRGTRAGVRQSQKFDTTDGSELTAFLVWRASSNSHGRSYGRAWAPWVSCISSCARTTSRSDTPSRRPRCLKRSRFSTSLLARWVILAEGNSRLAVTRLTLLDRSPGRPRSSAMPPRPGSSSASLTHRRRTPSTEPWNRHRPLRQSGRPPRSANAALSSAPCSNTS